VRNRPIQPSILQLITTLDPGGAEHQLLTLCKRLGGRYRFSVAYFKGEGALVPRFKALGIQPLDLGIRGWIDPFCLIRLRGLVRRLRPDLIVTHLFKADVYGWAAAIRTGIPLVSHKHNEDQFLLNPFFGALGRLAAARCHRIVSISDAVTCFYTDRAAFPAEKFVRILHGIERPLVPGSRSDPSVRCDTRRDLGAGRDDYLVGTVARLTEQKGIATLLRAMKLLVSRDARYRCVIAGEGEDEARLKALCRELGLEKRVRFAGHRSDIPALLEALDVFVLPSLWEGFGIVLLEAMALDCPLVASCTGGIPEVVEDGATGLLVPPGRPEALATAVHGLIQDEGLRRTLVRTARQALDHRFSADRMAQETAALYDEVLGSRLTSE